MAKAYVPRVPIETQARENRLPAPLVAVDPALLLAVALTLVALALRLHDLDRESLWLDEGYSLLFSGMPLQRLLTVGGAHEHPPLFYLIVHGLSSFSSSYLVPRVISAVSGAAVVFAVYLLGRAAFNRYAGVLAALLVTVSPFHLWYSRDGRAYELAGLFVVLSYLALFTVAQRPGRAAWLGYVACTTLALYSEYTTALVLLPQGIVLIRAYARGRGRYLLGAWLVVGLLFLPWLGTFAYDATNIFADYWIPRPTSDQVVTTILEFLGFVTACPSNPCVGVEAPLPFLVGHEGLIAAALMALAGLTLVYAAVRWNLTIAVFSLWLVAPFGFVLLLSFQRSLYLDRVFLDATFPLYLLLGAAAAQLLRRVRAALLPAGLALLVLIGSIGNISRVSAQPTNPDWKTLAHDLASVYRPAQGIVYHPGVLRTLLKQYLPAGWRPRHEFPLWYHPYLDIPQWQQRYKWVWRTILNDRTIIPTQRYGRLDDRLRDLQLAGVSRRQRRLWLVTLDYSGLTLARRWFVRHGYHLLLSELYAGDTRLELWDQGEPADLGPPVLKADPSLAGWAHTGFVGARGSKLVERGPATAWRSFPIQSGRAYVVNMDARIEPGGRATISVETADRSGRPTGGVTDRFGHLALGFPRTEWYDLPANGVWINQPFGFFAPPGAMRAVLRLHNLHGTTSWRHIAVYRLRPSDSWTAPRR